MVVEKDLYRVGEDYVEARIIESLSDLLLSLTLWKEGYTRNSAGKAFSAVKALLSALIVTNEEKLINLAKDEKERKWIKKKAHIVPTHAMYGLAQVLKDIGIDVISLVNYALNLHDYHYNGFEPGFSRYSKKEEVFRDLITLVKETRKVIDIYYSKYEVKEILGKIDELIKELTEGNK
ncbi:PaREP1 family protein [Sulfolobus islandicus Y.G.57.14]|uniref:PaREP1 family protein n=3 Tax=Saccharolobus islandicus TaxID=43080 RepID=C3MLQ9_SACI2|nr:PaREP1 family protein [Sulfolobus islandicus L.S.2.15]ACP44962.1 PaREP1 family protein [Sulfolobus islandicus Y.G.57.14]ACP49411.1 PaREP1 family protein [Sulfolobus islandicus Y.N.15.51]